MTRSLGALAAVATFACGPSKAQRDAEQTAFGSLLDHRIEMIRAAHSCDPDRDASLKALRASSEALKMNDVVLSVKFEHEYKQADARVKACESQLPTVEAQKKESARRWDAWMDACLDCAPGKACIAAARRLRDDTREKDPLKVTQLLTQLKAEPVCRG